MHPQTSPGKLTPDVDVLVRPPRTGVNTASGARGLGVEEVAVLEVRTGVATRKLTPDIDVLVRPPRTGVNTAYGARGLGVEEVAVLGVRTRVATRTLGAGGGRLQANELAAAIQDEVAPGENCRMTPHAVDP